MKEVSFIPAHENDHSAKLYELQVKNYLFNKRRKSVYSCPCWQHFKYYATEHGVLDALKKMRSWQTKRVMPNGDVFIERFRACKRVQQ